MLVMRHQYQIKFLLRMPKYCIICLLTVTLLLRALQGLTTPFNSCSSIEINSIQITNLPSFDFFIPRTTPVPFATAQPDNFYQALVSFQQFELSQADYKISINMYISSKSASSIIISFTGADSGGFITLMRVSYLVVPSVYSSEILAFTVDCCFSFFCFPSIGQSSGSTITTTESFPTALGSGNSGAVAYFNSVFLQTSNYPTNNFGQSLDITIINSTHFSLDFTNVASVTMYIGQYVVSVIAYHEPYPSLGIIISVKLIQKSNPITIVSNVANTFFGVNYFSVVNGMINFAVNSADQTMTLALGAQMESLKADLITFSLDKCCVDTPYIDTVQSICTDSCPARTYLQANTVNCLPCAYDCYTCSDSLTCLACSSSTDYRQYNPTTNRCDPILNYYDPGTTVAARCFYPHCCGTSPINFYQNSTCLNACPKNYTFNSGNKSCGQCSAGYWPISNHCTNIVGCKATYVLNLSVLCMICDSSINYALSNNTCVCSEGYLFSTETQACKQVCGDGYHFNEKCDDGNLIDGDGCSSACALQTHFRCKSDSPQEPSKCLFVGSNIKLTLNWVNKTEGKNQGVFSFRVSTLYVRLNLTKVFLSYNFTSEPTPTSTQITTSQYEIFIYADYDQDLQGNMAYLSLQINPDYIENVKKLSINFLMSSVGAKLVVIHSYPAIATVNQVIKILSYVVIGVFVVASLAYRMIGVESLHSFLVIYFVCLETANQTEPYMLFSSFKPINLNFMEYSSNFYSPSTAFSYQIQDQLKTKQLLTTLMFLPLLVLGIMKIVVLLKSPKPKQQQNGQEIQAQQQPKIIKIIKKWSYNLFLFPISIGFLHYSLFPAFVAQTNEQNNTYFRDNMYRIAYRRILLTFFCSFVYFTQFKRLFTGKKRNPQAILIKGIQYQSVYLFFWFRVIILLSVSCVYKSSCLQQYLLFLYIQFGLLWFLRRKPYRRGIHNYGQVVNIVMVMIFLSWSIARKYFQMFRVEDNQILAICGVLLLMFIALLLTAIRTFLQIRENCKSDARVVKKSKGKKSRKQVEIDIGQVQNILELENIYRLRNMLLNKRLMDVNCEEVLEDRNEAKRQIFNELRIRYLKTTGFQK